MSISTYLLCLKKNIIIKSVINFYNNFIWKINTSFKGMRKTMTELDNSVQRVDATIKQIETSVEHVDSAIHGVDSSI